MTTPASGISWWASLDAAIEPEVATATAGMLAPSMSGTATIEAPAMVATAAAPAPIVQGLTPTIPLMAASAEMLTPAVRGDAIIAPPAMTATATALTPEVITGVALIAAPVMTATAAMPTPGVIGTISITPPVMTASSAAPAPSVLATTIIAPTAMTGSSLMPTPSVTTFGAATLAVKGTPIYSGSSSVSIPTHAVGDLIIIFAFDVGSSSIPSKPGASGTVPAWVDIDTLTNGSGSGSGCRAEYFTATASNTTSGTWSGANSMIAVVLSGQASTPIGGHNMATSGTTAGVAVAPAVTMNNTDGTSVLLHFFGWGAQRTWNSAPAGYTQLVSGNAFSSCACLDSKNVTTSDGACTQTNSDITPSNSICATVEIRAH